MIKKASEEEEARVKEVIARENASNKASEDATKKRIAIEQAKSATKARVIEESRAKLEEERSEKERKLVDAQNALRIA